MQRFGKRYNMCGIVGYIGTKQAAPIILDGLSKLEYRGYDSAGMAVIDEKGKVNITKSVGRLKVLENMTRGGETLPGICGIGHTRWATHGVPSDSNAHPHFNESETITVVHNGIIENYIQLRKMLTDRGYKFISETDTEVVAHLLDYYYKGNPLEAVTKCCTGWRVPMRWAYSLRTAPIRFLRPERIPPLLWVRMRMAALSRRMFPQS